MTLKLNKKVFWKLLLSIASLAYLVAGIGNLFGEINMLLVFIQLSTVLSLGIVALRVQLGKINFDQTNDGLKIFLPIGFVLTVVGASGYTNFGVWGFGLTLLIVGLFFSPDRKLQQEEEDNAA